MKSALPKVLHRICGRTLLGHVLTAARGVDPRELIVVVGHGREQVSAHLAEFDPDVRTAVQHEQTGTGSAVRIALDALAGPGATGDGVVVVTSGDTPLLTTATLRALLEAHAAEGNAATVLTAEFDDPTGYGRILRDDRGAVTAIVEQKDATAAERAVREINSGIYAFDVGLLRAALGRLTRDNAQGEEYLTDVLGLLRGDGRRVGAVAGPQTDVLGINDRVQLAEARRLLRDRIVSGWMLAGVTVVDPQTTWMGVDVELEPDTVIHQNTQLHGRTRIARGAEVGPDTTLRDTTVGAGASVVRTVATRAEIGDGATVGPFTYLRPGTKLGAHSKAGAYVEIKSSTVGERSKVPHLSYVGDADIGVGSNIGAATVFVNYDGVTKARTTVGDNVRVGSDSMLVAPITIGDGAYTAAGSVITVDVPPGAMAVARGRQRNIEGWVSRRRPGTPSAEAAQRATEGAQDAITADGVAD
jgi:bifunctional UDP-N-acetylglucosamine pyrophosphorylase/glucosamine-1-phosphate N-acetyltransferase